MFTCLLNTSYPNDIGNFIDVARYKRIALVVQWLDYQTPRAAPSFDIDSEIPIQLLSSTIVELMKMQLLLNDDVLDRCGLLKHVDPSKKAACNGIIASYQLFCRC